MKVSRPIFCALGLVSFKLVFRSDIFIWLLLDVTVMNFEMWLRRHSIDSFAAI